MPRRVRTALAMLSLILLFGCAHPIAPPEARRATAEKLASAAGWERQALPAEPFTLITYTPKEVHPNPRLTIYIEGDGLAWTTRSRVSPDPTPRHPIALELALRDNAAAAYLARPCQFVAPHEAHHCGTEYWTDARFSEVVIKATGRAIDDLKARTGATSVELVGYSGGGAVAALVAAHRTDISGLITVAGNLDHRAWTRHHRISPLDQSLNPADYWRSLQEIPQVHFVGKEDRIVGEYVAESYRSRFPDGDRPTVRTVEHFTHGCCWAEQWPDLLKEARILENRE